MTDRSEHIAALYSIEKDMAQSAMRWRPIETAPEKTPCLLKCREDDLGVYMIMAVRLSKRSLKYDSHGHDIKLPCDYIQGVRYYAEGWYSIIFHAHKAHLSFMLEKIFRPRYMDNWEPLGWCPLPKFDQGCAPECADAAG